MSLIERIEDHRRPERWDDEPTEEDVLRQFLFSAIANFLEENEGNVLRWLRGSDDEVPGLNEWVDEYGDRPVSEPDGYQRHDAADRADLIAAVAEYAGLPSASFADADEVFRRPSVDPLREAAMSVVAGYFDRTLQHDVDLESLTDHIYALDAALRKGSVEGSDPGRNPETGPIPARNG